MTLRTAVFARCTTHAGTAALIGTRCYSDRLKENTDFPAMVHHSPVSSDPSAYRTHDGAGERTVSRVQLDCYDTTSAGAEVLATQVWLAWNGFTDDCDIGYAFVANRIQTREDAINAYRTIVDVMVEHLVAI